MSMSMGFDQSQQQTMRASPALIALNSMLVMSTQDLQQLVQKELDENPALDMLEQDELRCPNCGRPLSGMVCSVCLHDDARLRSAESGDLSVGSPDEEHDPLLLVAAPITLGESLRRDLRIALPPADHAVADYLIGSLDEHGFLAESTEEIADTMGLALEQVERVLKKLHDIGPPGVGARSVQECLLLQLNRLEAVGIVQPHVRAVLREHWLDLGEHRYGEIARVLGISYDDVVAVREFMREHLRPFPLEAVDEGGRPTAAVLPDALIYEEGDKLKVEVVESRQYALGLNPLYQQLAQQVAAGQAQLTTQDKAHMAEYLNRARLFLTNMRQRRETIRRITEYLADRQEGFLRHGVRHLEPLTRAEVAAALAVHESTVSRATANKYVQVPNRQLVSYDTFFKVSLSVKDVIAELVSTEVAPLTDDQIVGMLTDRGIQIARRTVAKYRSQLGILPSHLR